MVTTMQSQLSQFITANNYIIQIQGDLNFSHPINIIEAANQGQVSLTALARKKGDFSTVNENGEVVNLTIRPKTGVEKPATILAAIELANEGKIDIAANL